MRTTELFDLNAVIHIDTTELDAAIEKANRLLSLLQEAKKITDSQEKMSEEQIKELELALFEFVKRASSKEATAAEVEALPAASEMLMRLLGMG